MIDLAFWGVISTGLDLSCNNDFVMLRLLTCSWWSSFGVSFRGGPFDTWGGAMVFLHDQTFFSTPSLNVQLFSDLIKSKHFFLGDRKLNIFFTIYFT